MVKKIVMGAVIVVLTIFCIHKGVTEDRKSVV